MLSKIQQGVDYSIFSKIVNAKTDKEVWDILKLSYKGAEKAHKSKFQSLRREYERYEISNYEFVEQYIFDVLQTLSAI